MWNHSKSLIVTYWWTVAAMFAWVLLGIFFIVRQKSIEAELVYLLLTAPALLSLNGLRGLLQNIRSGSVFIADNVEKLRLVSWACFFGACGLLLAALRWPMLVVASGGVGFLGLFCRVMKNMLAEAIFLKEENELTI